MPQRARPQPVPPAPGQESVWDYPRPPRLERTSATLEIWLGGERIACTAQGFRVLETSHPPTYYLPKADRKSTRLNSSHIPLSRMPSSA